MPFKERPIIINTSLIPAILEGRKTQTRRVLTKHNSECGEGRVDWSKFDFYQQTYLSSDLMSILADGAEPNSIADVSLKEKGRSPLPWADNSVPHWQYLHVPYRWAEDGTIYRLYPQWEVGDRLWVKETLRRKRNDLSVRADYVTYASDFTPVVKPNPKQQGIILIRPTWQWKRDTLNARFMPRWASRITLEITGIRVERLQGITEEDAEAEGESWMGAGGGENYDVYSARECFANLWDSLNAKRGYGWEVNPWVWVIEFRRASV